jgi:hypothetical protein
MLKQLKHGILYEGYWDEREFIGSKTYSDGRIEKGIFDKHEDLLKGSIIFPCGTKISATFEKGTPKTGKVVIPNMGTFEGSFHTNGLFAKGVFITKNQLLNVNIITWVS